MVIFVAAAVDGCVGGTDGVVFFSLVVVVLVNGSDGCAGGILVFFFFSFVAVLLVTAELIVLVIALACLVFLVFAAVV